MELDNKILSKYEISILDKKEVKIEKTKLYTLSFLFFIFALALLSPLFFPELLKFSLEKDESSYSLSIYMLTIIIFTFIIFQLISTLLDNSTLLNNSLYRKHEYISNEKIFEIDYWSSNNTEIKTFFNKIKNENRKPIFIEYEYLKNKYEEDRIKYILRNTND